MVGPTVLYEWIIFDIRKVPIDGLKDSLTIKNICNNKVILLQKLD